MTIPTTYPFTRYLAAKKSVDDRSLNRGVWDTLTRMVASTRREDPIRVLEIGSGIGTMVERALDWGLVARADYTALDAMAENISLACRRLPTWAIDHGYRVEIPAPALFRLKGDATDVAVTFDVADVFDFMAGHTGAGWDLLIANAFLDLVDVPSALPQLLSLLPSRGLFYFTVTFDGATIFQPEIDRSFDMLVQRLYHETMDHRVIRGRVSGDSCAGRHFFQHLRACGGELLDAGSSDWVVFAGPEGYREDEEFFLHFIVHTVGSALTGHPELDPDRFHDWVKERHNQVEDGTLVYIAHQMDFVGRAP